MSYLVVGLLLILSVLFFGIESIINNILGYDDIRVIGSSLTGPWFRAFLGAGIVFCEIVVIDIFTSVRRTTGILKESIKLLPVFAFILTVSNAFWPILSHDIIGPISDAFESSPSEPYLAQAVDNGSFMGDILLTLAAMLAVIVINRIVNPRTNS